MIILPKSIFAEKLTNNIAFTFDGEYDQIFHILLASILINADKKNQEKFHFFINYYGSVNSMKILNLETVKVFPDINFTFKHIPTEFPEIKEFCDNMYDFENAPEQIQTSSVFCRLFLSRIYPNIDLMLHMDLDMIVKSDLTQLFDLARKSKVKFPVFSCLNECIHESSLEGRNLFKKRQESLFNKFPYLEEEAAELGLKPLFKKDYKPKGKKSKNSAFNAGILIFDLNIMKEENYEEKFLYCMKINLKNKIFKHNDQGILNFLFYDNVGKLPTEWNAMWFGCGGKLFLRCEPTYETAKLLHFNGPLKPWSKRECLHTEAADDWRFYQKLADEFRLKWLMSLDDE